MTANVAADLVARVERNGWAATALFRTDDRVWTHGAVHELAARAATVLAGHGVGPGDRVLLALGDGIGWAVTFLAAARLGAIAVLVNPELTADDHRLLTHDCGPALCVTEPELADRFHPARWLAAGQLLTLAAAADPAAAHSVDTATPLYVQYTSGTTGEPKGAVHRHGDLPIYADAVGRQVLAVEPADVGLSASRLFFAYGFGNAFVFPLYTGSSAVLVSRRPSAATVAALVQRHRVSLLYAVPSAYAALVAEADSGAFTSLRAAVCAGETLPPALGERVATRLGTPIYEQIGSTEVGHAFCANSVHHNVPGTLGRVVPGYEVAIRDAGGNVVVDGVAGELWVRGPTLLVEYLNRPVETERVLVDGWLTTGDRACRQVDGSLRHLGRVDDMEMVGGITVSPLEVERVLAEHPSVHEVAVAAVLDPRGASRLRAFVVPADTDADRTLLETELIGLARRRLAAFKVPRSVDVVAALPRTHTGKLRRHLIRSGTW